MFYEQLMKICTQKNIKATSLLKELNIPTGSLGNWKNGAMPNSKVVILISTHLNVSCDYLLIGSESETNYLTDDEKKTLSIYRKLNEDDKMKARGYINELNEKNKTTESFYEEIGKLA